MTRPRAGNFVDAKQDTRAERPPLADERTTLVGFLAWQRDTLALKCEGLSAEQLAERSVPPSTMSLLGLVRHMAEVERHWFRRVMAGDPAPRLYPTDDPDDLDGRMGRRRRRPAPRRRGVRHVASRDRLRRPGGGRDRRPRHHRGDTTAGTEVAAVGARAHDRGVRTSPGPRRPPSRADRRPTRSVARAVSARTHESRHPA
jgi:hypothetical protein